MPKYNATDWTTRFKAWIAGTAPFTSSDPLLRKADHDTVMGDDLPDSVIFRVPKIQSINAPAAAFDVDFSLGEQADIDTTGSGGNSFVITLSNLDVNQSGKLNITKKPGDIITFANGEVLPFNQTEGQDGLASFAFFVYAWSGGFKIVTSAAFLVTNQDIKDDEIEDTKISDTTALLKVVDGTGSGTDKAAWKIKELQATWNMDEDFIEDVPHGVINWQSGHILGASVINNAGTTKRPIPYRDELNLSVINFISIEVSRKEGGVFDNPDWNNAELKVLIAHKS